MYQFVLFSVHILVWSWLVLILNLYFFPLSPDQINRALPIFSLVVFYAVEYVAYLMIHLMTHHGRHWSYYLIYSHCCYHQYLIRVVVSYLILYSSNYSNSAAPQKSRKILKIHFDNFSILKFWQPRQRKLCRYSFHTWHKFQYIHHLNHLPVYAHVNRQ